MSLKAKIESVIYAAEEPVTLSQLVAIFAAEVPLSEPLRNSSEELQTSLTLSASGDEAQTAEITTIDASGFMQDAPLEESGFHLEAEDATPATTPAVVPETGPAALEAAAEDAARRAAKVRDREVRDYLRTIVDELVADYALGDRGIEIREIAGGFRMATKPEFHDAVRAFVKSLKPSMKLSNQALETLAVIAYKQPVTAPEIGEIRGVDSGGVLAGLISRKLVTTAGRKQVIGRPILYKTTRQFLMGFGLKDLGELPSLEEFEKIASELAESDALEASALEERAGVPPEATSAQQDEGPLAPTPDGAAGADKSEINEASLPSQGRIDVTAVSSPKDDAAVAPHAREEHSKEIKNRSEELETVSEIRES